MGHDRTCGTRRVKKLDLHGQRFGKLTAVRSLDGKWVCKCDCGGSSIATASNLRSGNSKSCGCEKRQVLGRSTTLHGQNATPTNRVWKQMRQRCLNPNHARYKDYGGRGITVCDRWSKFQNFLADMGERPEGLSLDRRDNDGPYDPQNCYWATAAQQASNTRQNRWIEWDGIRDTLSGWARRCQCDPSTVSERLAKHGPKHLAWFLPRRP